MEFRPCIDIHNGQVKQIVGASLGNRTETGQSNVKVNFVSEQGAAFYASLYQEKELSGGHVILLNAIESANYAKTKAQALEALRTYPGGLQIGGGMTPYNSWEFLAAGASHVIVTSYVFKDGEIDFNRLKIMSECVGKEHLVLDLSCRKRDGSYRIMTDRWRNETDEIVNSELLDSLSEYCDEFLIHAVDVEGKADGIESELVALLGRWGKKPITYAGGVHNFEDLALMGELGQGRVDVTVGSALSIFGGSMDIDAVADKCRQYPPVL